MFNVMTSGTGNTTGNMMAFGNGAMAAAVVSTKEQAEKIAESAKENLRKMKDMGSGETPIERGIGYEKIGKNRWAIYSKPVGSGSSRSVPYFVEFGRPALRPREAPFLYFRQKEVYRMRAGAMDPIPFFREAIQDATKKTTNAIDASMKRAPGLKG